MTAAVLLSRSFQPIPGERAGRASCACAFLPPWAKVAGLRSVCAALAWFLGSGGGGGDGGLAARCSCWWAGESARAASGGASLRSLCVPTREGRGWPRPRVFGGGDTEASGHRRVPKAGFESSFRTWLSDGCVSVGGQECPVPGGTGIKLPKATCAVN